jgi:hypothetical protein
MYQVFGQIMSGTWNDLSKLVVPDDIYNWKVPVRVK